MDFAVLPGIFVFHTSFYWWDNEWYFSESLILYNRTSKETPSDCQNHGFCHIVVSDRSRNTESGKTMTESINRKALDILDKSEQIYSPEQIQEAIARLASELNRDFESYRQIPPLVLSVMGGAVVFTGQLLPHLTFPLEFDFLHVSRYGNEEHGGEFIWKVIPRQNVINRLVIVLDDILDEGQTLLHIREKLLDMGAAKVILVAFAEKNTGATKPVKADYVGLSVPNQFVIGFGMDTGGLWRNLPDIRVLNK